MGFIDGLGRFLSGKPVFTDATQAAQGASDGPKYIPRLVIVRAETHVRGNGLEISVHIKNQSNVELFVDKIRIFEKTVELDDFLKPGDVYEPVVYSGPKFADEKLTRCELQYRTKEGDYFTMQHIVDYGFSGGMYIVQAVKPVGAVRDI